MLSCNDMAWDKNNIVMIIIIANSLIFIKLTLENVNMAESVIF